MDDVRVSGSSELLGGWPLEWKSTGECIVTAEGEQILVEKRWDALAVRLCTLSLRFLESEVKVSVCALLIVDDVDE